MTLRATSSPPRLSIGILAFLFALPILPSKRPPSGSISTRQAVRFDLNRDPPQALMALPGLGPVLVGELVAAREAAPLVSLQDVDRRVRGIGPARARAIAPYVAWPEQLTARR